MIFRIHHIQHGHHVHMRVFVGPDKDHLANCGELTMREPEFANFKRWLYPRVQFHDDGTVPERKSG